MTYQGFILTLITSGFLSLSLLATPSALADYQPSPEQKTAPQDQRSDSGTTRGCDGGELLPTVFASRYYIGQTISTHPTFAWFIPDAQPRPLEFTLYEFSPDQDNYHKIYTRTWQSSPGIMMRSPFAENQPGLELGKIYAWQVVVYCEANSPSSALFDRGFIEVVPIPPGLVEQLVRTADGVATVNLLAEAGLWYDALTMALQLTPDEKLGHVGANLLNELANAEESGALSDLDEDKRAAIAQKIWQLQQIAELAQ